MTTTDEISYLKHHIQEEHKEIKKLEEKETHDKFAESIMSIYSSLMAAGFTEEKAWLLLTLAIKSTFKLKE